MYFTSEEAENRATNNVIETHRNAKSALAKLDSEMSLFSKQLSGLALALKNPSRYEFQILSSDLRIFDLSKKPFEKIAYITEQQFDWAALSELLHGYNEAREDLTKSAERLRDMGC